MTRISTNAQRPQAAINAVGTPVRGEDRGMKRHPRPRGTSS